MHRPANEFFFANEWPQFDQSGELASISVPTLVIVGGEDPVCRPVGGRRRGLDPERVHGGRAARGPLPMAGEPGCLQASDPAIPPALTFGVVTFGFLEATQT